MLNSPLRNKSKLLVASAELLHNNFYYPAVAHASYYSCYQLMKYIWLYSMGKSQEELDLNTSLSRLGSHEYLLNEVVKYVNNFQNDKSEKDARSLRNDIPQLKRLRTDADYSNNNFDSIKSLKSIRLSKSLLTILKQY
ncbi:MAG TPA: hypothetical protein PLL49_04940 [Bacteroidales bacterium]|nr:hypothetical protein [Bacteroidales bacterium]